MLFVMHTRTCTQTHTHSEHTHTNTHIGHSTPTARRSYYLPDLHPDTPKVHPSTGSRHGAAPYPRSLLHGVPTSLEINTGADLLQVLYLSLGAARPLFSQSRCGLAETRPPATTTLSVFSLPAPSEKQNNRQREA